MRSGYLSPMISGWKINFCRGHASPPRRPILFIGNEAFSMPPEGTVERSFDGSEFDYGDLGNIRAVAN